MGYRIGIDAGSKTIKVVVVDEHGTLVHSLYRRHRSDIKTTLAEALHDLPGATAIWKGPSASRGRRASAWRSFWACRSCRR